MTAAIGLAIGLGSYVTGTVSAAALIFALTVLRGRRRWLRRFAPTKETVVIRLALTADAGNVLAALKRHSRFEVRSLSARAGGGPTIAADLNGTDATTVLAELADPGRHRRRRSLRLNRNPPRVRVKRKD